MKKKQIPKIKKSDMILKNPLFAFLSPLPSSVESLSNDSVSINEQKETVERLFLFAMNCVTTHRWVVLL